MSGKQTFWLEDNPDFFSWFKWVAQDKGVEFDIGELFSRIAFAYAQKLRQKFLAS